MTNKFKYEIIKLSKSYEHSINIGIRSKIPPCRRGGTSKKIKKIIADHIALLYFILFENQTVQTVSSSVLQVLNNNNHNHNNDI